jgi:hypothetical protein
MLELLRRLFLGNKPVEQEGTYCGYIALRTISLEESQESNTDEPKENATINETPSTSSLITTNPLEIFSIHSNEIITHR